MLLVIAMQQKWGKQPFFPCVGLVHKNLCWQHCFLIKKEFWAWDVINAKLWEEKWISSSKDNPNYVWFMFQQALLENLSLFIKQCHLDRTINRISHFSIHCNNSPAPHWLCKSHVPAWGHLLFPLTALGWKQEVLSQQPQGRNEFPADSSSPLISKVKFPSAEPLHTERRDCQRDHKAAKWSQGSAVPSWSYRKGEQTRIYLPCGIPPALIL